jgi:hypothetical protein
VVVGVDSAAAGCRVWGGMCVVEGVGVVVEERAGVAEVEEGRG